MKSIGILGGLLLLLAAGCAPYVEGYYYAPHPALALIPATQPSQPPTVAAFASVVGIRRQDDQLHLPLSIEVRLRIDNNGSQQLWFDPRSMQLTSGDLIRFGPPLIDAESQLVVDPGQSALITANFPFPGGKSYDDFDLSSLELRWGERVGPQNVGQVAEFRRAIYVYPSYYYGPYWDYGYPYPYPYFHGVVIIRRR